MCWHHQSVWPKLHRHSNITSNHCSSFQTTLNSLVWSLWSNLSKRCLIGALRAAVWRAHTPLTCHNTTALLSLRRRRKVGFRHVAIMRCDPRTRTMQCVFLVCWPSDHCLWPGACYHGREERQSQWAITGFRSHNNNMSCTSCQISDVSCLTPAQGAERLQRISFV